MGYNVEIVGLDLKENVIKFCSDLAQKLQFDDLRFEQGDIKGFDQFFGYADKMSPLGNASSDACADYAAFMFSDLSRMITMQNLYHDGGFSAMGMNPAVFDM